MPFESRHLIVLSYWNERTLWHYRAGRNLTISDVCAPDYMDGAAGMVRVGDTVWITAADGSRTTTVDRSDESGVVIR